MMVKDYVSLPSLGYEYPFVLKAVTSGGNWCAWYVLY